MIHSAVPVLASIRKPKEMGVKNYLSFSIPILTPSPPRHPLNRRLTLTVKKGDILNNCLMTVDGTDFRVPQKGTATKGNAFVSHKYTGKSALRYKLGMSILRGDLVWTQGPYPVGKYTDINIFNKVLHHFLDPGEQVEADKGYVRHPNKIKCPQNVGNPAEKWAMQGRERAHHKILNRRLKKLSNSLQGLLT